ncbi:hypothetical protein JHW43_008990 [Diplocarpon mali]|nr:hypothetical protein JHW43_008990 [Diplocarpon mali]
MNAQDHIYPEYCHSLSPTIGKWCPLLVTDVHRLRNVGMFSDGTPLPMSLRRLRDGRLPGCFYRLEDPGFCGLRSAVCGLPPRPLYHLDNHPVKWVRVTGVVLAVDECRGKRVYVVDDSSGMTVECAAIAPAPAPTAVVGGDGRPTRLDPLAAEPAAPRSRSSAHANGDARTRLAAACERKVGGGHAPRRGEEGQPTPSVQLPAVPWQHIDVGTVVKVKGRVGEWWGTVQIEVVKMDVMRGVDEEVRCWDEVLAFRRGVVGRAWVVGEEMEARLRREREREQERERGRGREQLRGSRRKGEKTARQVGHRAGTGEGERRGRRTRGADSPQREVGGGKGAERAGGQTPPGRGSTAGEGLARG